MQIGRCSGDVLEGLHKQRGWVWLLEESWAGVGLALAGYTLVWRLRDQGLCVHDVGFGAQIDSWVRRRGYSGRDAGPPR